MKDANQKQWWKNKREIIWRIKALASQLRTYPNALTEDLDGRIKLNKIGKAFEELAECLLALEGVGLEINEEPKWYESVMLFWKIRKIPEKETESRPKVYLYAEGQDDKVMDW